MQAKGCWNADGQELGGSCREGCGGFRGLLGVVKAGKRQARMP